MLKKTLTKMAIRKKRKAAKKKPIPTNKKLYARVKAQTKRKFAVYPSAYANMAASKYCKSSTYGKGKKKRKNLKIKK